jgi:hypothetical protein
MAGADFPFREFRDWAGKQPADKPYCYTDAKNCAVSQFGRDTGREHLINLWPSELRDYGIADAVNPLVAVSEQAKAWTFGALVDRLEALIPAVSPTWTKADAYLTDIEQVSA